MDGITRSIAEFAAGLEFADLPGPVVREAQRRVLDSLGCALAAYDAPPVGIALSALGADPGSGRVIGMPEVRPSPDNAAFLNTTMIRYLDFNDWAPSAHPSDVIGPLLALADSPRVSGQRLVAATVVGYEVFIGLGEAAGFAGKGWDQGFALGIAAAAAIGNLRGLSAETIAHAVGVMAASGLPTGATRSGSLSMWKGMATAYAVRNAMFVSGLAEQGLTGPPAAFEGRRGVWQLVTGPFELDLPEHRSGPYRLTRTAIKPWPVCYHAQAPIEAALELRDVVGHSELEAVEVATYEQAWRSTASEPERWDPRTRETADHSLPYLVARALVDGAITLESFTEKAYTDPGIRHTMAKITAVASDEATAAFPQSVIATLTARDRAGKSYRIEVTNPVGHPERPMSEKQFRAKFADLVDMRFSAGERDRIFDTWNNLTDIEDLGAAMEILRSPVPG